MSILLNCSWKKKYCRREKTIIIKRRKTFFCGWKAEPGIQEMESKSRDVPCRKPEVVGLQIIKHANFEENRP